MCHATTGATAHSTSSKSRQRQIKMVVVVAMPIVVVVGFCCSRDAWAWTRQAPWYMPCAQAVCVMCCEFVACVYV